MTTAVRAGAVTLAAGALSAGSTAGLALAVSVMTVPGPRPAVRRRAAH